MRVATALGRLLFAICATLSLLGAARASAQATGGTRAAIARSLFEQGVQEASVGNLARAKELFGRSRDAAESVSTLLNLSIVCSKLGEWPEALAALDDLEALLSEGSDDPALARAQRLRAEIAPLVASMRFELTPVEAQLSFPRAARARRHDAGRWYVLPGEHTVHVEADGYVAKDVSLTLVAGDARVERLSLERAEPVEVAAPSQPAPSRQVLVPAATPPRVADIAPVGPTLLSPRPDATPGSDDAASTRRTRWRRGLWIGGAALVVAAGVVTTLMLVKRSESEHDGSLQF